MRREVLTAYALALLAAAGLCILFVPTLALSRHGLLDLLRGPARPGGRR